MGAQTSMGEWMNVVKRIKFCEDLGKTQIRKLIVRRVLVLKGAKQVLISSKKLQDV